MFAQIGKNPIFASYLSIGQDNIKIMNNRPARAVRGGEAPQANGRTQESSTQQRSARPTTNQQPAQQANQPTGTGDAWDELDDLGNGFDDGFNKMNTSFFLSNKEEVDIVLVDESPVLFNGHNLQCISSKGKKFWRTEACQKSHQSYCVACDRKSKSIGNANKVIAFRVLDSRGTYDSQKGDFNWIPAVKIFLAPIYVAKIFKSLKDQAGTISDKVIKLSKDDKYMARFDMINLPAGGMDYNRIDESIFDGLEMPEIEEVYAPMSDEDLNKFIDDFVDFSGENNSQNNQGGGQSQNRGFGNNQNGGGRGAGTRSSGSARPQGGFGR